MIILTHGEKCKKSPCTLTLSFTAPVSYLILLLVLFYQRKIYRSYWLFKKSFESFKCDVSFKNFTRNNWISMIVIVSVFILAFIHNQVFFGYLPFHVILGVMSTITFDVDIIIAIRYIKFLESKVVQWNHRILSSFVDRQNEECRKRLFEAYFQILKSYNIYKQIFQFVVSLK